MMQEAMYGYGSGMLMFGLFGFLIFIGLIVLVIWVLKAGSNTGTNSNRKDQPLETLKQRLARGEISEEEYDRLKNKVNE
ncbi:hypothetical protein GCM10011351_01420 [Paraliobacillus quinghaiensis]|uniref:SHOCT domain-containing protein n=1 Tax=Paraliobacillus quinghaiensis TaxID=470815 RepID=A0A917TEJ0_9BACI|nr:SHOCT domain-containing protein [Paraliobacillus quinghaiensis]GGM19313.1 hypothetical protein GCM10011351_01420 [Paraliobacillus quinghaiensis]